MCPSRPATYMKILLPGMQPIHTTGLLKLLISIPFRRSPQINKVYNVLEDSPSSIKAVISDTSCLDPDSSVEYIGQKSSPHSRTLRHLALAQANLLEVRQNKLESNDGNIFKAHATPASGSRTTNVPYRRRHIPFTKSPSPPHRSFSSERNKSEKDRRPTTTTLDWDDPILNPVAHTHRTPSPASDSSELPELPFLIGGKSTTTSKTSSSAIARTDDDSGTNSTTDKIDKRVWTNKPDVAPSKMNKLRAAGRQHLRAEKEARMEKKQARQEELKNKYHVFSYDNTTAITPKIWYYRGLASGDVKFMGCDIRSGFSAEQPRSLKDVLGGMKG